MRSTTNNWKMPVFAWISVTWSRQMPGQLPERVPDWQSPMAIPRRRRERQHHDVPPPWLRVPRWIQRGPGMAMAAQKWAADGWWWNDAGISEAAVLIYRCQDIVIIPPPKKNTILLTARWKVLFRHGRFWFDHQTRGAIEARLSDRCHGSYGSVWSIRWSGDVRLECRLAVKLGTVFERNVWDLLHLNILNISLSHIKLKVKRSIKYIYIYIFKILYRSHRCNHGVMVCGMVFSVDWSCKAQVMGDPFLAAPLRPLCKDGEKIDRSATADVCLPSVPLKSHVFHFKSKSFLLQSRLNLNWCYPTPTFSHFESPIDPTF